jgi:SAM-dependent methyltransferase
MHYTFDPQSNGASGHSMFFIFGSMRSGTTSICSILDKADNAVCLMEPYPQMHHESRLHWEKRLDRVEECLRSTILQRAEEHLAQGKIYGEKNVPLYVFAKKLTEIFPCKLVYVTRDGRDVVSSMRQWHAYMFGNLYREGKRQPPLSSRAQAVLDSLPLEKDDPDFGRPRPLPGDPYYERWPTMTHHEMLCWHWNAVNMHSMDQLETVPETLWRRLDYSSSALSAEIAALAEFLGLTGITEVGVHRDLEKRINSIGHRTGLAHCATWRDWTDEELDQFWQICSPAMQRLGYFSPSCRQERRWTPDYGSWWKSQSAGHEFYESIYLGRIYQHEKCREWLTPFLDSGEIASALEICCGHGIGYAEFFKNIAYTGLDISPKEIQWCRENRHNPKHAWICADFIRERHDEVYDLVLCQGSIECCYDMDEMIRRMAGAARRYVYLPGFLGYHMETEEHAYHWDAHDTCYYNIFSIPRALKVFEECGFTCILLEKIDTGKASHPFESLMVMKRGD